MADVKTEHNADVVLGPTNTGPGETAGLVACGEWNDAYRKHFLDHYALNGGEYGRYSEAYHFGHQQPRWDEEEIRKAWEARGQGSWDDFKEAIRYGFSVAKR